MQAFVLKALLMHHRCITSTAPSTFSDRLHPRSCAGLRVAARLAACFCAFRFQGGHDHDGDTDNRRGGDRRRVHRAGIGDALAARGTKVTLVERGLPGAANSTLTGGGIRQQFGSELNIRLSKLSGETWDHFAERFGIDPLFRAIDYLFLARTEQEAATLAAHVRLQNSIGVDSESLDSEAIAQRWPVLSGRGFIGGGFRAADGWANQHRIIDGFVRGAIAAGVELLTGIERWRSRCPATGSSASRPLPAESPPIPCSSRPARGSSRCSIP
jgi:FAD dependent oxidoreductase